jgi:hypothetical protein
VRVHRSESAVTIVDQIDDAGRSNSKPGFGEVTEIEFGVYGGTTISRETYSTVTGEDRECSVGHELENLVTRAVENKDVAVGLGSERRRLYEIG